MIQKVSWLKSDNIFRRVEGEFSLTETIPVGIYNIHLTREGWHLERFADRFVFDYKVYGLQKDFCEHVLTTYKHTTGNLGILLNGTKGTGKTVTAKVLANSLNLPIIIVKDMGDANQSMIEYLSGFNFDCILFLDEFEKNFSDKDSTILQIMDGVYNIGYRKVFLLTTNEINISDNLIGRPSRIRYLKEFGNLDIEIVNEYLDDFLKVPEAREELINFINTLSISTIDILKSLVTEVNIHGIEGFRKARSFFNVTTLEYEYTCVRAYTDDQFLYDEVKRKNAIDRFMKEVKNYMNPKVKPAFMYSISSSEWTTKQREEAEEWYDYTNSTFNGRCYTGVELDCKYTDIHLGDRIEGGSVVYVDAKNHLFITHDSGECYFYYVTNPNSKPSLYSKAF